MGLELTETLHGILPIAPNEELLEDNGDYHHLDHQNLNVGKTTVGYEEFLFDNYNYCLNKNFHKFLNSIVNL